MDMATLDGIRQVVAMLVNWSCCTLDKLGYDPTIRHTETPGVFEIDCAEAHPKGKRHIVKTYLIDRVIVCAMRVFGRHTRCFVGCEKNNPKAKRKVIKDSWPLATSPAEGDDLNNEIEHLELIRNTFHGKDKDFLYLEVASAEVVQFTVGRNKVNDDTDNIFELYPGEERHYRVHRRIAMSPCGENLKAVRNENEFAAVLADAMRCHNEVLKECQLLHRDISSNNILVVRDETPNPGCRSVHGLLIDFDHAISVAPNAGRSGKHEISGTLPFMSIHNLCGAGGKRTALDDWESLLYMVCWHATYGINSDDRKLIDSTADLPIQKWRVNTSMAAIASEKRYQMDTLNAFLVNITEHFIPKYTKLRLLAIALYRALFQHKGCEGATIKKVINASADPDDLKQWFTAEYQERLNQPGVDPLVTRVGFEEPIIEKLLEVMSVCLQSVEPSLLAGDRIDVPTVGQSDGSAPGEDDGRGPDDAAS
ncbi:hypothetical protein EV175_002189 [Coemansia sp. RSA 1933]|nr:hypothetical protein EV175_002189 [Coemansia sp. RSA 1933]